MSRRGIRPPPPDIAILVPDLRGGGAERVSLNLANHFHAEGLAVELVLCRRAGLLLGEIAEGVSVHALEARRFRDVFLPLARYLRRRRPRSVIAMMWPLTSLAVWARGLAGPPGRLTLTDHNMLSLTGPGRPGMRRLAMRLAMRASYPFADAVVAVSNGVADDIADLSGLDRNRIKVIHNPITPLPPPGVVDSSVAKAWLAGDGPRLVAVGSLKPQKDLDTLLKALARLRRDRPDARLLVLGDGPERAHVEALITELDLDDAVTLGGFQPDPHGWMARADLFVLSSRYEGFANVLVEALALGLPLVSTDCPSGPAEILEQGRHGKLTPPGDAEALALALSAALDESPDREALRRRADDFSIVRAAASYRFLSGL